MNEQQSLICFHGDQIQTIKTEKGVYVAMRPIVENMGLSWASQTVKLNKNKKKFNCSDIETVGSDGRKRFMVAIPLRKLNGWLFSVSSNKVSPKIKEKVEQYQEECFHVLHNFWFGKNNNPHAGNLMVLPKDYPEALRLLADSTEREIQLVEKANYLEERIVKDEAKVLFATQIEKTPESISIADFAKILNKHGFYIGQNSLFEKFISLKYIFRDGKGKPKPMQRSLNAGWMEMIEKPYRIKKKNGAVIEGISFKILITGKGQVYFAKILSKTA